MRTLVLDAMGVIYSTGDDVKDLLCPFIEEKGGTTDVFEIERLYHTASLGNVSASKFWKSVGLDLELEDEYLQRHRLTDGLIEFLRVIRSRGYRIWCLSNDLSEWSRKLRILFGLDKYICGFIISGDVGVRKPAQAIFKLLIERIDTSPREAVIVDDQQRNLDVASILGFHTILYSPEGSDLASEKHHVVKSLKELAVQLS